MKMVMKTTSQMTFDEYLRHRFKTNNHTKYLKYMEQWIEKLLPYQLEYFKVEQKRLGL
jgi:hypothetical protein